MEAHGQRSFGNHSNWTQYDRLCFRAIMFAWSKVAELGDTLFLVLRKREVIFLHWYHHASVIALTWMGCE
jgi:hypothetical protein